MFLKISTTTNKISVAENISKILLDSKLTACTNISPKTTSTFIWKNKLTRDDEYILSIKTINSLKDEVINTIEKNHNYEVPEIISTKIDILSEDYKIWFIENLRV